MSFRFAHSRIICFSTADWDTLLPTNKHQMMRRLAARGAKVLYIETLGTRAPSLSSGVDLGRMGRRLRRALQGPVKRERRLWTISPVVRPAWNTPARIALNKAAFQAQIRPHLRHFPSPLVWVYSPHAVHLLDGLDPAFVVYHRVDRLDAVPGADITALRRAEDALLTRANVVFCTERSLYDDAKGRSRAAFHLPNVADYRHFAHPREPEGDTRLALLRALPHPRILFSGNLAAHKVDFGLLDRLAGERPGWQFVLVGPSWEGSATDPALERLRRRGNVMFLGHVAYEELPPFLHEADVLLIPYLLNEATEAVSPLKLYEYLATGKPVVSSALPSVAQCEGPVSIARGAEEWLPCIEAALEEPHRAIRLRRSLARRNTWEKRIAEMEERIAEAME